MIQRWIARQPRLNIGIALVAGVTFWAATNYCLLEALTTHPVHNENSHHSDQDHYPNKGLPRSGADEDLCCATLQALLPSKEEPHFSSLTGFLSNALALPALRPAALTFTNPSRIASGLSPPTPETVPRPAFYRSVFASHAPPVFLA